MAHDKIRAAARKRMAQTGEPYSAARRAVVCGHQADGPDSPPPGAGFALRMSGEIHDWLADLRGRDESAALRVVQALARLMQDGASLGDPLVVSTADSWPWVLAEALDRSYQQRLERLTVLRRGEADAATLVKDIQGQVAELEAARATLEDVHRRALDAGSLQGVAQAAGKLAAVQQQEAEARRLLPKMIEASHRLGEKTRQLQTHVEAFRFRKETMKARHAAERGALMAREAMAALDLAGEDGNRQPEDSSEAISAETTLADITAQMERELGQEPWPEGLMDLRPGAPWHSDIRILFAVEPPGTALLIAVMEGLDVVEDQYPEAVMASAAMLRQVRAGQVPEAAAHAHDDVRSFLEEFYPGTADDVAPGPVIDRLRRSWPSAR